MMKHIGVYSLVVFLAACSDDGAAISKGHPSDAGADATGSLDATLDAGEDGSLVVTDAAVDVAPDTATQVDAGPDVTNDGGTAERRIWLELTWQTPGDPTPNDQTASDLNLHFKHPDAIGVAVDPGGFLGGQSPVLKEDLDGDGTADGWFTAWDVCWHGLQIGVDWVQVTYYDAVTNGGPETMSFGNLPTDKIYRIGVDYWDDKGLGSSIARVRVIETVNSENVVLGDATATMGVGDFWQVADYDASTGEVTILGTVDAPLVTTGVTKPPNR